MKLKPPTALFDSEEYLRKTLETIESLVEWLKRWSGDEFECPTFDIQKDYANYYKKAISGKISKQVIDEHQEAVYRFRYPFDINISEEVVNVEHWGSLKNRSCIGEFNIFITLRPLLNQFYLFASLSNAYFKQGDLFRSVSYAVNAADAWGSIKRLQAEVINVGIIELQTAAPFEDLEKLKSDYKKNTASLGGTVKRLKAQRWAAVSWILCTRDPAYEILFKKYSGKGRKFSDSLFDLLKEILKSRKMKEIPYGSSWFYEEVFLKLKSKEIKTKPA